MNDGLLTREQLRSSTWRRVFRGVYADAQLPDDHGLRARGAMLLIPPGAALTGRSAAWLWGVRVADRFDPVDVVAPPGTRFRGVTGIESRTAPIPSAEITTIDEMRVTLPVRTAWEVAIRLDPVEAVAILDAMLGGGRINTGQLDRYLEGRPGQRSSRERARKVFDLLDCRSGGVEESRLRARLVLAGLPAPVPRHEFRFWNGARTTLTLAWPGHRIAVRYGEPADGRRPVEDVALGTAGWLVYTVTDAGRGIASLTGAIRHALHARTGKNV